RDPPRREGSAAEEPRHRLRPVGLLRQGRRPPGHSPRPGRRGVRPRAVERGRPVLGGLGLHKAHHERRVLPGPVPRRPQERRHAPRLRTGYGLGRRRRATGSFSESCLSLTPSPASDRANAAANVPSPDVLASATITRTRSFSSRNPSASVSLSTGTPASAAALRALSAFFPSPTIASAAANQAWATGFSVRAATAARKPSTAPR